MHVVVNTPVDNPVDAEPEAEDPMEEPDDKANAEMGPTDQPSGSPLLMQSLPSPTTSHTTPNLEIIQGNPPFYGPSPTSSMAPSSELVGVNENENPLQPPYKPGVPGYHFPEENHVTEGHPLGSSTFDPYSCDFSTNNWSGLLRHSGTPASQATPSPTKL